MSDSIETKGKTVDLAVSEALLQLGLRRDEVEIKVLEEPRAGLMGFIGARQAKVLVTKRRSRGGSRFGGRDRRRDDDGRAHDLTAEGSSGRGRGGRGGGREGARDEGGRGGRGGRDGGRDERGGRGGRGGGRDGGRDGARDGGRDGGREARSEGRGGRDRQGDETPAAAPRARDDQQEQGEGQRSRRRRGGRGRGGRGRTEQGAPREDQQPNGSVAFDAADDTFETPAPGAAADRGDRGDREERGGRGGRGRRGGRGGRGRGGERGERPAREFDGERETVETAGVDEFVVNESPGLEPAVPREQAREQRSRRDQHAGEAAAPVAGHEPAPAVESEVIESAVVANVAPRAKPRAWGGLGARRAKPAAESTLPRVEQESPATAGSVYKPPRTKQTRPVVERPAAAAKIGEIDAPSAGGYGAPRGGAYGSPRSSADEVIASGIAATDYAKALAPVDEAGQPALLTELTNGMLARAGFPCEVETIPGEYHAVKVSVDEDGAGMLIGRGGQTAEAVEHLVERMASNAAGDRVRMNLDINDYRVRREGSLRERTLEIIADVRATGEPYHMEPMDARERRVVHLTAEEQPDITTYTVVGSGGKHVVIALREDGAPGDGDGTDED